MKLVRVLITCALLGAVSSVTAPTEATGTVDITTEDGLRAALDRLETRYEAICVRIGRLTWDRRGLGSDPVSPGSTDTTVFKDLSLLYADPELAKILAYWAKRNTMTHDPSLSRRVALWSKTRDVAVITLNPAVLEMEDALAAGIRSYAPSLDGKSATRAELQATIAGNPDATMRRKAWSALADPPATTLKTDVWKLIRLRAVLSQPIKEHWFHDLIYHAQDLEPYWTFNMMEVLMKRTQPAWDVLLASLRKTLGKEKLQPWDYDHALEKLSESRGVARIIQTRFKPEKAVASARALLESLGFDMSVIPLTLEIAASPLPAQFVPVSVPADLRGIVNPPFGPAGIIPYYEQVFRMHGHAARAAFNRQGSPMMKGYPWIPGANNSVYAEGMAAGFSEFLRDPLFLARNMDLSPAEIDLFLRQERDRRLLALRRRLLSMAIEFTVYVNPDADLDARYRDLAVKALGVEISPAEASVWRTDPMLVTRPVQHQNLMLAETIGRDLHGKLSESFGDDRLGTGKPAAWLVERCFAPGENFPLQERLFKSIQGGFDFDGLVRSLGPAAGKPGVK